MDTEGFRRFLRERHFPPERVEEALGGDLRAEAAGRRAGVGVEGRPALPFCDPPAGAAASARVRTESGLSVSFEQR